MAISISQYQISDNAHAWFRLETVNVQSKSPSVPLKKPTNVTFNTPTWHKTVKANLVRSFFDSVLGGADVIKDSHDARRSLLFDKLADDGVVEVVDGFPRDALLHVLLLKSNLNHVRAQSYEQNSIVEFDSSLALTNQISVVNN